MARPKSIYWDSDCFLAWFNAEEGKSEKCRGTLQAAEKGEIKIVTSAITLVEVIKIKDRVSIQKEQEEKVESPKLRICEPDMPFQDELFFN